MILRLRQRHRRIVIALGVILPVAFSVGIAARKPVPSMKALPAGLAESSQKYPEFIWGQAGLFDWREVTVELLREKKSAGDYALRFSADEEFVKPDLLVYWIVGGAKAMDKLPENALLLGAFDSPVIPVPESVAMGKGSLLLYSLANQQVLYLSKPLTMQKP